MTMACHGVGPGSTAIGADDACGGMWTAWAGAAVTGSPSVGVIVASPWTVRRRWWRPVGGAQVVVGSVIEWRRMAWSPGVISSHRSVPLWTAHSRGRSRNLLRSGVVRCCGGSSIVVMGWVRGRQHQPHHHGTYHTSTTGGNVGHTTRHLQHHRHHRDVRPTNVTPQRPETTPSHQHQRQHHIRPIRHPRHAHQPSPSPSVSTTSEAPTPPATTTATTADPPTNHHQLAQHQPHLR